MRTLLNIALLGVCFISACGGGGASPPVTSQGIAGGATTSTGVSTGTATVPAGSSIAVPVLKWVPKLTDTWQWQLQGSINTNYQVGVYDIDLFNSPQTTIDSLHAQGKRVVCYFSGGSSESFRPDFPQFVPSDMGNTLVGYANERWLDTRSANVRSIMKARLDLAVSKNCDGVEPDNVEGFSNNPGFPLTDVDQIDFNTFLAVEAHARGLAIALKNDIQQIPSLLKFFDFALNEQCFEKNECAGYSAFIDVGKPVLNAEYAQQYQTNLGGARDALCVAAKAASFHTLVLPVLLNDTSRYSCD